MYATCGPNPTLPCNHKVQKVFKSLVIKNNRVEADYNVYSRNVGIQTFAPFIWRILRNVKIKEFMCSNNCVQISAVLNTC